jgi:hypothetical protein
MSSSPSLSVPLARILLWLSAHAGFPRSRLESRAEILLCLAAVAEADAAGDLSGTKPRAAMSYDRAALRAHTLNRAHTQFKSDNASKV